MDVLSAIEERSSIRGFRNEPVSREIIEEVLDAARMAPSASNQQPWHFVVVAGNARERLANDLVEARRKRATHYDPSRGKTIPATYLNRTRKLLTGLHPYLSEMGKKTVPFLEEGSCFFYGAPVLILVAMDRAHPQSKLVDIGCAIENLVLAARAKGLGTCIIALILMFEDLIVERLAIADNMRVVAGIALGYPDGTLPVNHFRAPKEDLPVMTRWIGFDE